MRKYKEDMRTSMGSHDRPVDIDMYIRRSDVRKQEEKRQSYLNPSIDNDIARDIRTIQRRFK